MANQRIEKVFLGHPLREHRAAHAAFWSGLLMILPFLLLLPASAESQVEATLPPRLVINCLTYGMENVTCTTLNLPNALHTDRVKTSITYMQVDMLGSRLSTSRTKVCSCFNTCLLTHLDGLRFGLPLILNISIKVEYSTRAANDGDSTVRESDVQTVTSEWLTFDIDAHVKVMALRASIVRLTNSTIKVMWEKQILHFGDKVVRISYNESGSSHLPRQQDIQEPMDFSFAPMEFTIRDLQPGTTYSIELVSRPVHSDIWSDPASFIATTLTH